jgi:hypothetical protein
LEARNLAVAECDQVNEVRLVHPARWFREALAITHDGDAIVVRQELPGLEGQDLFSFLADS